MSLLFRVAFFTGCVALIYSCSPIKKYQQDPGVLSWEKHIREFEKKDSLQSDPDHAILFTGSSSIRLWSSLEEDMTPFPVIQRGYGGAHLTDFAVYCKRIIYPHQFDAMVLFVANDIAGQKQDREPEEVLKLFNYIVKQVRKKYSTQPIFFIEITPTNSRWKAWDKISAANALVRKKCLNTKGLYFIETASAFLGEDGKPMSNLFREDQLHLNKDGYAIWTRLIKNELAAVLGNR